MNPADLFRHDSNSFTLTAGSELFHVGDASREMFVLLEGSADIRVGDAVVEVAEPGALLGEMAMIEDAPRVATVARHGVLVLHVRLRAAELGRQGQDHDRQTLQNASRSRIQR